VPVLGKSDQLKELVDQHKISMLVLAITHEKSPTLINALTRLAFNGCQLVDMPNLFEYLTAKVPIDYITDIWLFLHNLNRSRLMYRQFKKVTDLAIALCGLALTWPLFILISVAIRLDSPGPVFFRQERLGKDGKPFQIVKFRTMVQDAERFGAQWACQNDPRITRVGRILRKLRLDELPQLINIFKGEMSLIGPRPEREVFIREFQEPRAEIRQGRRANDAPGTKVICNMQERLPYYSHRLVVKPGLTGWAQVMYPYAASLEDTREKLCYDLYYIKNMGFFLDLSIVLKTIRIILFGRGR
jgi:lipopolysaccharide/colanic/teichoic acid biosynthesis glycosyltransferase